MAHKRYKPEEVVTKLRIGRETMSVRASAKGHLQPSSPLGPQMDISTSSDGRRGCSPENQIGVEKTNTYRFPASSPPAHR